MELWVILCNLVWMVHRNVAVIFQRFWCMIQPFTHIQLQEFNLEVRHGQQNPRNRRCMMLLLINIGTTDKPDCSFEIDHTDHYSACVMGKNYEAKRTKEEELVEWFRAHPNSMVNFAWDIATAIKEMLF